VPSQRDIDATTAAVTGIVFQCQSVGAGFIAEPDAPSLKRDVDVLLRLFRRVRPDETYVLGSKGSIVRSTTLRREVALARRNLTDGGCAPKQADRLRTEVNR